jgi:DNA repair protein RecO (recombination protein O)
MESTLAILMRRSFLTETSLIVTWFTEKTGKVKTAAKGARRPKSAFAGKLDLFYESDIQYSKSRRSDLHLLREVMTLSPHEAIRRDYRSTLLASYWMELIELVTEPEHPVPELFDLLRRALAYLEKSGADKRALSHFENEAARCLGIYKSPASVAIGRVYHRLPPGRSELIRLLQ